MWLLLACGSQSYPDGLRALCDAPLDPRIEAGGLQALQTVIDETVRNPRAHALAMRLAEPGSQAVMDQIREDTTAAGIASCPLIEPVRRPGPVGLPKSR